MEIKVKFDKSGVGFLTILTAIFFGIFLTSIIFALATRFLGVMGIWVGLVICAILIFLEFYYIEKKTTLRYITRSIMLTVIIGAIAFLIGLIWVQGNLETLLN